MKLLNLDSGDEAAPPNKKKSKWLKIGIGVSALVLIPTIGSTLAGSITIGSGSLEFGQGVVETAACDGGITVAPASELTTTIASLIHGSMPAVAPYFSLASILVSDINGMTCESVLFTIKAFDIDGNQTPLCDNTVPELYVEFVSVDLPEGRSTGLFRSCGSFITDDIDADQSGDGFFEWEPDLDWLYLDSSEVNTITIESSTNDCSVWCD